MAGQLDGTAWRGLLGPRPTIQSEVGLGLVYAGARRSASGVNKSPAAPNWRKRDTIKRRSDRGFIWGLVGGVLPGPAAGAFGRDNTLKMWDAASGALLRTFTGHSDHFSSATKRAGDKPDANRDWSLPSETGPIIHRSMSAGAIEDAGYAVPFARG